MGKLDSTQVISGGAHSYFIVMVKQDTLRTFMYTFRSDVDVKICLEEIEFPVQHAQFNLNHLPKELLIPETVQFSVYYSRAADPGRD